jgi:hypothetical protein
LRVDEKKKANFVPKVLTCLSVWRTEKKRQVNIKYSSVPLKIKFEQIMRNRRSESEKGNNRKGNKIITKM